MSGPKAVTIVSKEELLVIIKRHIERLDAQFSIWIRTGEKHGVLSEKDIQEVRETVEKIHNILATDDPSRLIKSKVNRDIRFLKEDMESRIEKKVKLEEQKRTAQRRTAITAGEILKQIKKSGMDAPDSITLILEKGAKSQKVNMDTLESAVRNGIAILTEKKVAVTLTEEQKSLVSSLSPGGKQELLGDWLARRQPADDDLGLRIDRYIAMLEVEQGTKAAHDFTKRAQNIYAVADQGRRRLLSDSLIMDLAEASRNWDVQKRMLNKLEVLSFQLQGLDSADARLIHEKIEKIMQNHEATSRKKMDVLIEDAESILDTVSDELIAHSRREAVLTALSSMGYEVREKMETAWVENNKVVIKKASTDYGVQLSGNASTGMIQMRPVAIAASASKVERQRGIEIETRWCSDLDELRGILSKNGGGLEIKQAREIGDTPVLVVSENYDKRADQRIDVPLQRHLDQ